MTMAEIEYTLADLIRFSSEQKPLEFGTAFNSLLASKISDEIGAKKVEVAQRMFNPNLDNDNNESEQEED